MLRKSIKYILWLLGGLILLVILMATEIAILKNTKQQAIENQEQVQFLMNEKEAESKDLIYAVLQDTNQLSKNWMDYLEQARNLHFILNVYKNDTLIGWSDQLINSTKISGAIKDGFFYINTNNGAYWVSALKRGSYKIAIFYQLKTNYKFQNQYIKNHFNDELNFLGSALFSPSPIQDFVDLNDRKGNYVCSIQIFGSPKSTPIWLQWSMVCCVFLIAWFFHLVSKQVVQWNFVAGTVFFIGLTQTARWLFILYKIPVFVYAHELFNPKVYGSSTFNPSLGDFLIAALLLLWYLLLIRDTEWQVSKKRSVYYLHLIFASLLSMVLADGAFDAIKSIVIDSQILFDVNNIYALDVFTFLALFLAFVILLCCYQIFLRLYKIFSLGNINPYEKVITVGLVFFFIQPYIVAHLFERPVNYVNVSSSLLLSFFVFVHWIKPKLNRFQGYFILVLLLSVFTSMALYYFSQEKEKDNRITFAGNIVSQNDVNADYFLQDVEDKIYQSQLVKAYYANPIALKSQLVKQLQQLYFSGYLSKYSISVFDYDSVYNHYHSRNTYSFSQVDYIYKQFGSPTITRHFRFLKNNAYLKGYLGKFNIRAKGHYIGCIFIHLQPKLQQDVTRFDELLIDGFKNPKNKKTDYSYAIYKDLQLLSQSGQYAYRTTYTWNGLKEKSEIIEENGYNHLIFKEDEQILVVVSEKSPNWYEPFGLFSLSFTFFNILLILLIGLYIFFNNNWVKTHWFKPNPIFQKLQLVINKLLFFKEGDLKFIRTQIQLGIILIVFLTLAVTAYFTISFITSQNLLKQNDKLVRKLRSVTNALENESQEVNFKGRVSDTEASINQIADFYNTIISFLNTNGNLITSTIKKVYEADIIAPLMNPEAFFHLNNLRESQYIQKESIATFSYTGAYAPIFSRNKELLGFVQLPDFYQVSDLNKEISSIMVGFINLYALMFFVIGAMAWLVSRNISFPLRLIQRQLAQTTIGKKNEPIDWDRNDEIGELVKAYNNMIDQLQESAEKLGRSEREGAWRDIARQIAHEIKNPLTPMKLSVQHLERAWNDQSPKLPETFKRVTKTLIAQIDILSELATEFSSFAKMPVPEYEEIYLNEMIEQVLLLQEQTFEGQLIFNETEPVYLYFDKGYLNRTLTNLVKNAIQAIPEDREGRIELSVRKEGELLHIEVKDNGTGIPKDQQEKIFMPYFSTKVIGMGLGLPIVKSMIESGGGKIWFDTIENQGTTFHILLPLTKAE